MLLATFFGMRGGLETLFFSTLLVWFGDDFVEIPGSVSLVLSNGIGSSYTVSFFFLSTLLD